MARLSKIQNKEASDAWQKACDTIEKLYDLKPNRDTPDVRLATPDDELPRHNVGAIVNGSIIINTTIPEYDTVISATMTKLCLESVLPSEVLCRECIDDLTFEFARKSIKDTGKRKHWDEIWLKHSPRQKISQVMDYCPSVGYRWLHSVAGDKGLDTIIHELVHRGKNQIQLSFEDYLNYFSMRVRRFDNILDSTELKLAKAVIDGPELQSKEISKAIDVSEEWISKKLTQLQKRMILRRYHRAPFSRIGIGMSHLLISGKDTEEDPFNFFKNCPFLYSYRKVVSGDWTALATLCIPENKENTRYLRRGVKTIIEAGFSVDLVESHSVGIKYCFDYYDTKIGKWNIPWELLKVHLQRIHSDGLASSIPRIDTPAIRLEIEIDDLDMQIIDSVWHGTVSVSKIRSKLKVGQHRVAERLQKLRQNGIIMNDWDLYNVGLNEHAIVYCKDKEIGETIAAWSLRLPRSRIIFSSEEELMLIVDLPKGGSFGIATTIEGLSADVSVGFLSTQVWGSYGFPARLWDSKFQRWKCPRKELDAWLEQIA